MKIKPKHTTGPWYSRTRKDKRESMILDSPLSREGNIIAGTNWIASVFPISPQSDYVANARLIAAAPDMLKLLKDMAQELLMKTGEPAMDGFSEEYRMSVDAVIGKAEGKQNEDNLQIVTSP